MERRGEAGLTGRGDGEERRGGSNGKRRWRGEAGLTGRGDGEERRGEAGL